MTIIYTLIYANIFKSVYIFQIIDSSLQSCMTIWNYN